MCDVEEKLMQIGGIQALKAFINKRREWRFLQAVFNFISKIEESEIPDSTR
jgi:hypothetical protein